MGNKTVLKKNKQHLMYLLLILFFTLNTVNAQQIPHYTQYLYNMQVINPAYVGFRSDLSISLLSRQQWVGVEGAPRTNTFSLNTRTVNGLGVGLTVVNDKLGLAESNNINIDASYTIITSKESRLAFGLKGGITFFDNNLAQGSTPDNDTYASFNGRYANIGFGALFYTEKYFVGLSVPHIFKTPIFKTFESSNVERELNYKNFFLSAGVLFKISEDILFKPATIIKHTENLPLSIDLNSNFLYKDIIETGISYRYKNSISGLFAIIINKKFRVGYTYDYKLDNFGTNLSSHEIILHLDLNFNRTQRWLLHNKCYF